MKKKDFPRAKDALRDLGVTPSKQRGQNFIIDPTVIEGIVEFGAADEHEYVIEIGPGLGALTERLMATHKKMAVVEIEERFCRQLQEKFPTLRVECADVRNFDFSQLGSGLIVFGNLPYSFSTEIIFHLLDYAKTITRAVLMLQREFAERVAAPPGGRSYGALSVNAQIRADVRLGQVIPGDSFHPKANVESMLLELRMLERARYGIDDLRWFRKVVQACFLQRRKKLKNSLMASGIFPGESGVSMVLEAAGIDANKRAEALTLEEFARLASCGLMHRGAQ